MADRFDLDAIEADDALLDLLAAGGESARTAGEHDPAVQMLAELRLAVEVEDELPVETIDDPESFLARCAALNPITDPFARKVATRGLAVGVAAVAALSVSGVAAAVTGDPLSPYEKVIEKMVDAVRPQTSFPKEDLDGLPVVDRSKIVKVGKNYQAKAEAQQSGSVTGKDESGDEPQARAGEDPPRLVLPPEGKAFAKDWPLTLPTDEQKTTQDPGKDEGGVKPTTPVPTDVKPTTPPDSTTTDDSQDEPTDTPTDTPTDAPTDEPTGTPTTPTEEPTETTSPTPTPTDTTTTTPPSNVENGTGGTGDNTTGDSTGDNGTGTDPTGDSGTVDSGGGSAEPGAGETTAPTDGTTTAPGGTSGTDDTSGTDTGGTTTIPDADVTQVPEAVKDAVTFVVDAAVAPVVLPTPTGEPPTLKSAERFFGKPDATAKSAAKAKAPAKAKSTAKAAAKKTAKHSSGQVSVGSVRKTYATGKHSSGQYPEGKHAAIARTHGSTADEAVLQILEIVNLPTQQR
ncbi:hypothetical protein [Kribbella shirazensis]|uniref:Uncharacterized protein n=1 Tax=Kribbella shirazensis TaxID=1105143 RepID=A0A7X5V9T4_9ACTN|nr:hypothetical protein [Kribbella shirazensis]NIK56587.1 hypothetical protein [Kribbella shirazensis]